MPFPCHNILKTFNNFVDGCPVLQCSVSILLQWDRAMSSEMPTSRV
jgi:hypothetical protein